MKKKGLAIGIIVLFIGSNFASGTNIQLKNTTIPLINSRGNTLYVGGTGEGNYSKIQDAIDNASDGDTVFVYDDSSPYYETLEISKSIYLIGENKDTTVIDGNIDSTTVYITTDFVKIMNFNIKSESSNVSVSTVVANANYVTITNNIISGWYCISTGTNDNSYKENIISENIIHADINGIETRYCISNIISKNIIYYEYYCGISIYRENNVIRDNTIFGTGPYSAIMIYGSMNSVINNTIIGDGYNGILIYCSNSNIIIKNIITGYDHGIVLGGIIALLMGSKNNIVSGNIISETQFGIWLSQLCRKNNISSNNITNNGKGILIEYLSNSNRILNNNFINNSINAYFQLLSSQNTWDGNYWDKPRTEPYKIIGRLFLFSIPCINYDYNPAQEPNDITTTKGCDIV